jgi:glycosyltransferase involved in cell wall biosynthesis
MHPSAKQGSERSHCARADFPSAGYRMGINTASGQEQPVHESHCGRKEALRVKTLLASYSDLGGGAARAASRILAALRLDDPDCRMVVAERRGAEPGVDVARSWCARGMPATALRKANLLSLIGSKPHGGMWSADWISTGITARVVHAQPDVVNLHWVQHGGVLTPELPHFPCPIVWTLHDLAPLTGGCHYPGDCVRWMDGCGSCPQLAHPHPGDLSHRQMCMRASMYPHLDLAFIAPSRWMRSLATRSPLTAGRTVTHIPNGLDLGIFTPTPMPEARARLGLPATGRIILFGADRAMTDRRKGFHLLREALPRLTDLTDLKLAVFGTERIDEAIGLPFPAHALGIIRADEILALAYSAANLFVTPSLEDNLPNTIAEALACGCPCAGFAVGGIPEMIEPGKTGALAAAGDPAALAEAIRSVLTNAEPGHLRSQARAQALADYDLRICGRRYRDAFLAAVSHQHSRSGHV